MFAKAKSTEDDGLCPLTRQPTFVEAIARVLDATQQHARKIESITVRRTSGLGVISYGDEVSHVDSVFAAKISAEAKLRASTRLEVNAMLTRALVIDIATDLKRIADSQGRSRSDALQIKSQPGQRVTSPGYRSKSPNRGGPKQGKKL